MHYRHNYRHNQLDHIYRTCISFLHELTEVVDGLPKHMVPAARVELAPHCWDMNLNHARLPIP